MLTQACNTMDETLRKRLEALTAAGRAQSLDFAGVAARVATDRFLTLAPPDAADIARYEKLMLDAASHLDVANAQRIAMQLAPCPFAPHGVLARLIALGPEAAAPILEFSPSLPAQLLAARASEGDAREAAAIARRTDLDGAIVGVLARRLESEALQALAGNRGASLDRGALIALTQRARLDLELGRLLLARDEPALDRIVLFLSAGPEMRRRILLDAARASLGRASLGRASGLPAMFDGIRIEAMGAATAGDAARFASIFARALRVARATIDRLVADEGGEPLGLMFAALGLAAAESERPMLSLRRDLAAALADPASGPRFALQASPGVAATIVAALVPGRPRETIGEYAPSPQRARTDKAQSRDAAAQQKSFRQG